MNEGSRHVAGRQSDSIRDMTFRCRQSDSIQRPWISSKPTWKCRSFTATVVVTGYKFVVVLFCAEKWLCHKCGELIDDNSTGNPTSGAPNPAVGDTQHRDNDDDNNETPASTSGCRRPMCLSCTEDTDSVVDLDEDADAPDVKRIKIKHMKRKSMDKSAISTPRRTRFIFKCSQCAKSSKTGLALLHHIQRFHDGVEKRRGKKPRERGPFKCTQCVKQYSSRKSLALHVTIHGNNPRPYLCSLCQRAFRQKAHLVTHLRSHSSSKPYRCNECGCKFSRYANARRHLQRSKHPHIAAESIAASFSSASPLPPERASTTEPEQASTTEQERESTMEPKQTSSEPAGTSSKEQAGGTWCARSFSRRRCRRGAGSQRRFALCRSSAGRGTATKMTTFYIVEHLMLLVLLYSFYFEIPIFSVTLVA